MILRVLVACVVLMLAGCGASRTLVMRPSTRAFTADDYKTIYNAWTRDSESFDFRQLQDVLHVTATFESWEFRWAYVVRYAEDFGLEPERRETLLRNGLAEAERQHRFFITMAGRSWRESDLSNDRSAWRVILLDDAGRQVAPVRIERVARPGARDRAYFPSISPFRQTFRISFPVLGSDGAPILGPSTRRFTLRFTGPMGRTDLEWELEATGAASEPSPSATLPTSSDGAPNGTEQTTPVTGG